MADENPPILMQRRGAFLVPKTPFDSLELEEFGQGVDLRVKITQPRSVPHHRLYWSVVRIIADGIGRPRNTIHSVIKLRTGYAEEIRTKSGLVIVPGSIAFDKMDQATFNKFFDSATEYVCSEILPALDKPQLEQEAKLMLGIAA